MTGIFNKMCVCIYELPCEVKCTRDGVKKSAISDEGLYGQRFEVIKRCVGSRGDFIRIKTDYGYEGYVRSCDVIICGDISASVGSCPCSYEDISICKNSLTYLKKGYEGCPQDKEYKFMQVKQAVADIMSAPFVSAVRLMSVTRGAILMCCDEIISRLDCDAVSEVVCESNKKSDNEKAQSDCEKNGYVSVRLYDGRTGYIKKSCLEPYAEPLDENEISKLDEDAFREKLVQTAKYYLGTQYRWGGKTPLGIDCSGLTSMAYMLNGVYIYRDAKLVPGFAVHEIPYECMEKGDLLYFPGHIAMYIGDGGYIHSTARAGSDGVVVNSLNPASKLFRPDLVESLYAVGSIFI